MTDEVTSGAKEVSTRCGFVALIGAPNVGKSTLVNALVGSKVTIVSRKVQTTRALIRGIVIENNAQIILVDTPGIFSPKRRLDRAMVSTAWSGAHDADLVCVLLDAKAGLDEEAEAMLSKLATVAHPKILVLNKIDLVPREKLLALAKAANDRMRFEDTFMIAAMSGDGVDDLRRTLARMVPPGPFHYPEDQMSDAPMRHLAAEITREKIFRQLHQELPYQSTVETDSWTERKDKSIRIEQTIFVERESQRKIVLGKGGATLAEHDLALAFALDKDRLLDADGLVLALGPAIGLNGGLIRQFLMQLAEDFFPGDFSRQMPHRRVRHLVFRIVKRPRRHHRRQRMPEVVDAIAGQRRNHEGLFETQAVIGALGQRQQFFARNQIDLVEHQNSLVTNGRHLGEDGVGFLVNAFARIKQHADQIGVMRPAPCGRHHGAIQSPLGQENPGRVD